MVLEDNALLLQVEALFDFLQCRHLGGREQAFA